MQPDTKASLDTCIKQDPKGLYKKAQAGEIKNMTGLQSPYEEPTNPEVILDTEKFAYKAWMKVVADTDILSIFDK